MSHIATPTWAEVLISAVNTRKAVKRNVGLHPKPSFLQVFGGASSLDPRIDFSRATESTYWQDRRLMTAGVDEPVFENGALRLEVSQTEFIPNNTVLSSNNADWIATKVDDPQIPYAYEFEFVSGTTTGLINTNVPTYPATNTEPSSGQYVIGVAVKKTVNDAFIRAGVNGVAAALVLNTRTGDVVYRGQQSQDKVIDLGGWWLISLTSTGETATSRQWRIYASDNYVSGSTPSEPSPGHKVVIALPSFRDSLVFDSSPIMTSGSAVTRAADSFSLTGEAFQKVFNPNEGALVFKIGEGSYISPATKPWLGLGFANKTTNLTVGGYAIHFDAKTVSDGRITRARYFVNGVGKNLVSKLDGYGGRTYALSWSGKNVGVFIGGEKVGEFVLNELPTIMQKVSMFIINKSYNIDLENLQIFTTRPTDQEMEAPTYA